MNIFKKIGGKKLKIGAIEMEMLAWWIIAIVILVLILVAYFILKNKGINLIEQIKNLFRFGRS